MLPPGTEVDGNIVSRSVLWFSLTGMVSAQSQFPEVAYLLLQWLGSSRIYSWMTANPGGYFDPFSPERFQADPLVRETYHAYHMDIVRETVARTVPTINLCRGHRVSQRAGRKPDGIADRGQDGGAGHGRHRRANGRRSPAAPARTRSSKPSRPTRRPGRRCLIRSDRPGRLTAGIMVGALPIAPTTQT